ncbi:MAG: serine/threonine-protein kinase [Candidatus Obscuribacterales bacterium]|nr:serine/threonine-protein kinase [Candidatus Obscuribacterales bacterium]
MPLHNSFRPNSRQKQPVVDLLNSVRVGGAPGTKDLSFAMLQAGESAPEPQVISWQSHENKFQLQVLYRGGSPTWRLFIVDKEPAVLQWSIVSEDPQQIQRLLSKRIAPEQLSIAPEPETPQSRSSLAIGATFMNRYRIDERIARGGMGLIFKATDMVSDRTVALKVLHDHLLDDEAAKRRFDREMQACIQLRHPNIVTVYDYGLTPDGTPFMVMEFLAGQTMEDFLGTSGCLSLQQFVDVFCQIGGALRQTHDQQIIHRDLKPSNIMLIEEADQSLIAKIVDFGIAKTVGNTSGVTKTGEVIGTLLYMSPEQCQNEPVDLRSDIYSLGCVMYETLAGKRPFYGETPIATMMLHIYATPAPLNNVPADLASLIFKTLEKQAEDRFQSMDDLLNALKLFAEQNRELLRTTGGVPLVPMTDLQFDHIAGSNSNNFLLSELRKSELPLPLELLVAAGLITSEVASTVVAFKETHGGDTVKYLLDLDCTNERTYALAQECAKFMHEFKLSVEEVVDIMKYCSQQNISFEQALSEFS